MKVFVPLTDDMLDQLDGGDLPVPYSPGAIPLSSLPRGARLQDTGCAGLDGQSISSSSRSPADTPSSSALPAFNSSTYRAGPSLG